MARKAILASRAFQALRTGNVDRDGYAKHLCAHFAVRRALESQLDALRGRAVVCNQFTNEYKSFDLADLFRPEHRRSAAILEDIVSLTGSAPNSKFVPVWAKPLITYVERVSEVYSVALLGVLYTLEEAAVHAGPTIAASLDRAFDLRGSATGYLTITPRRRQSFRDFRAALDSISDLQTQVNIVTASTLSYRMYADLVNLRPGRPARRSSRVQ